MNCRQIYVRVLDFCCLNAACSKRRLLLSLERYLQHHLYDRIWLPQRRESCSSWPVCPVSPVSRLVLGNPLSEVEAFLFDWPGCCQGFEHIAIDDRVIDGRNPLHRSPSQIPSGDVAPNIRASISIRLSGWLWLSTGLCKLFQTVFQAVVAPEAFDFSDPVLFDVTAKDWIRDTLWPKLLDRDIHRGTNNILAGIVGRLDVQPSCGSACLLAHRVFRLW